MHGSGPAAATGRFERAEDNSERESALYTRAVADLHDKGWPVQTVDCTTEEPDAIAARIVSLIQHTLDERAWYVPEPDHH